MKKRPDKAQQFSSYGFNYLSGGRYVDHYVNLSITK